MARRLPRSTTRMVGRDGDLARLTAGLERERVAVIAGMPGVGKSTLALAYAERWAGPAGWIAVARAPSIAAITAEVFRQLEVAHYDQDGDDATRLVELMALIDRERALVVLDDLHAMADGARLLAAARRGLRRGRLIATSRERTANIDGDAELVLEPLDRAAAAELCAGLVALFGPGVELERAWGVSRGNPFLLRQAHIGAVGDHNPLDGAYAGLDGDARVLALALALASAPLAYRVLVALAATPEAGARALDTLARRLITERPDDGDHAMHDLIREALLRTASEAERAAVRDRLIEGMRAALADDGDALRHVPELVRLLRGQPAALAALLDATGVALVLAGADDFVRRELEALPAAVMTPRLRLLHARALCHGLQFRRAYELLATSDGSDAGALLLGNVATWAGELVHAEAVLTRLAGSPDPTTRSRAELGLAWVRINRGTWRPGTSDAPAFYAESLRLCDALLREQLADGVDAARFILGHAGPAPREPWARLLFPIMLAPMLARAGELDEAERAVAWLESAGVERDRAEIRIARALIAIERGERIAPLAVLRSTIRLFDRGSFFAGSAWVRTALARALYQLGRRREAGALIDELRARCVAHATAAYDVSIAVAEQQDPLHPAWLRVGEPPPPAKRGDVLRHQVRAALAAVAAGRDELPAIAIGDDADSALDRACLTVGRAALARRHGQRRVAAQLMQRAAREAVGVDPELVGALYEALARPRRAPGALTIDRDHHELRRGDRTLSLAARPALRTMLYAFVDEPTGYLSHDAIAAALWQTDYDPERHASTLKSNVRRLRVVLGELGVELLPEPGGYRLVTRPRGPAVE